MNEYLKLSNVVMLLDRKKWIVALEPGPRTFITGYFSDGMVIEEGDMRRVYALLQRADQLHFQIDRGKQKYRRP